MKDIEIATADGSTWRHHSVHAHARQSGEHTQAALERFLFDGFTFVQAFEPGTCVP